MEQVKVLLQISAKLYQHLAVIPKGDDREEYIEQINEQLDERGIIIEELRKQGFIANPEEKAHATLIELDKGIRERLNFVMKEVKHDLKDLQNSKKNEQQYMNPYASIQVMDGRYYDKKN
ncbi:flagellar protein FliT [Solibacillus sp. FSL K6-1523]|uniref:flagellar protein FliT n=1 Tax=Solibacillus sp. FSL K6-1523 TaxID=2921471 RepID=UPI0030F5ACC7